MLTWPGFTADLGMKKPENTGLTGVFDNYVSGDGGSRTPVQVEPAGVEPASKQGQLVLSTCLFCN